MPLTIEPFISKPKSPWAKKAVARILERILGIHKIIKLYDQFGLEGLPGEDFLRDALGKLNVNMEGIEEVVNAIPEKGPVVIAANHPFGGLEGMVMIHAIIKKRPDVKALVNRNLSFFPQMCEWSIFTNPLKPNNPKNAASLRACKEHLAGGNALLLFPAGRVGYYHKDRKRIADHDWNRLVAKYCSIQGIQYCPVFIHGQNSRLFYLLGRIWFKFRLLLLPRELTNKRNTTVSLHAQNSHDLSRTISSRSGKEGASLCRALSYIHHPDYLDPWPRTEEMHFKPLAEPVPSDVMFAEADTLPQSQILYTQGTLTAYFANGTQIPNILKEIARRREMVFRSMNEGSGETEDTDKFDNTYTHLFVLDSSNGEIAGAYRMGQTDILQKYKGQEGLYLSQMFKFGDDFINQKQPCLEMGRSFLMPEYQRSRFGLYMLWRAIGEFIVRHPQYSTLYGTVSISNLYDKRSVKLIEELAITPTDSVSAQASFDYQLHPEVMRHFQQYPVAIEDSVSYLDSLLAFIEPDKKKLPVLLRQYASLGAKFHCLGVDKNFADTPGLLLVVDMRNSSEKQLKKFLGPNYEKIFI